MALGLNFHPSKDAGFVAESKTFDGAKGFVTFSIRSGSDDVTFFVNDVQDAHRILNAAVELLSNVIALNAAKAAAEGLDSVTV
jgi:hypothetical protein